MLKKILGGSLAALTIATAVLWGPIQVAAQTVIDSSIFGAGTSQGNSISVTNASCSTLKETGITGVVACAITFFNYAIYLVMAGSVVYIVYGASKLMREEGREEGKNIVMYGIIGLFVMVSVWGLVNILNTTFKLSSDPISPPKLVK